MAWVEHPRVSESITVTGTGSITTGTVATANNYTFASACAIGDTFPLWIVDKTTTPATLDYCIGTYTATDTVSRTAVAGRTLVSFAGNACDVFIARLPSVMTSGGASSQGLPVVISSTGNIDTSLVPGIPVNAYTANHTAMSADNGTEAQMNVATANTFTIDPTTLTGMRGLVRQTGAGQTTIAVSSGSITLGGLTAKTLQQGSMLTWYVQSSSLVYVNGECAAS
jgi:hypothetical protein